MSYYDSTSQGAFSLAASVMEVCEEEGTGNPYEWRPNNAGVSHMLVSEGVSDQQVVALTDGEYEDGPEDLMAAIHARLRRGDPFLAADLLYATHDANIPSEGRCLALETLASARLAAMDHWVVSAVRDALDSPDPHVQFTAIASLSDLPRIHQVALGRIVRQLVVAPSTNQAVRDAAEAFLRRRGAITNP